VFLIQASHPSGRKVSKTIHFDGRYKPGTIPVPVQRDLAELVGEMDRERTFGPQRTFRSVAEEWLSTAELAPSTRYSYERYLQREVYPAFGTKCVREIGVRDIDDFHRASRKRLAPATQRQIHAIIRNVLKAALKWGYLDMNVATMTGPVGGGAAATHSVKAPTAEEVGLLMEAAAGDPQMRCYLLLSAALGSRRGETTALRWHNIDFEEGSIRVEASVDGTPGSHPTIKSTKTHAEATLAVGPKVIAALKAYREHQELDASLRSCEVDPHGYLFSRDPRGIIPWDPGTATHKFSKLRASAGLGAHVKLKNLRHFHATQLLSAGVDVRTVAGRLRHASANTTYQFYAKFDEKEDRKASAKFDAVL
jgi:integrase